MALAAVQAAVAVPVVELAAASAAVEAQGLAGLALEPVAGPAHHLRILLEEELQGLAVPHLQRETALAAAGEIRGLVLVAEERENLVVRNLMA